VTELELSAQAPWTRTMLDLGPLAVVVPALACAELVIPAVSSSPAAAGDAASAAMRLLVCFMLGRTGPRRGTACLRRGCCSRSPGHCRARVR
jgi:hypothetical protein